MNEHHEILALLPHYFEGMFFGDVERLRKIFHPQAVLFGVVNGAPVYRGIDDWLSAVSTRKSPKDSGEKMTSSVLSIELTGNIALAKVNCPMLGFNYVDYLTLNKIDGDWVIVTKTFTHLAK